MMEDTVATRSEPTQFWSPYGRYWSGKENLSAIPAPLKVETLTNASTNSSLSSDFVGKRFDALLEAIARLPTMPKFSEFYMEPDAAKKACDFLGLLRQNYDVTPPKIIPEENDTVVLTWDMGEYSRYLSVADDWYDLLDIHHTKNFRCKHEIPQDEQGALHVLVNQLHLPSKSTSTR